MGGRVSARAGAIHRAKHRFSVTERRRQIPAEEETDSRDPHHHPWSGVVAKTPHGGLRVLWGVEFAG